MKSLWCDKEAQALAENDLALRVYTSRLLGQNSDLVLHGGGNTSVKSTFTNLFGDVDDVLYVKGSGWDLATIEAEGFAPVRMDALLRMAELPTMSDTDMVLAQRAAMTNPKAPNPSVEAILHAIIPFKYVDHTHADAVVAITNTPKGRGFIEKIYGDRILIVPYVMPGFVLARKVYEMTQSLNWQKLDGMILMNHGVFSFADDARESYENMISLVHRAEKFLKRQQVWPVKSKAKADTDDGVVKALPQLRRCVSDLFGGPVLACLDKSASAVQFSQRLDLNKISSKGPLTPDHVIRTKRLPMLIGRDVEQSCRKYKLEYEKYFHRYADDQTMLDPAPRWAVWPGRGVLVFERRLAEVEIIADISQHTMKAIQVATDLGGWKALPARDIFDVEYWELEQAKLKRQISSSPLIGRVAIVTGAASGIGRACVLQLAQSGSVVIALDFNAEVKHCFDDFNNVLAMKCDITKDEDLSKCLSKAIKRFGGVDMLISNAGVFPASATIVDLQEDVWQKSLAVNCSAHQKLMQRVAPILKYGYDPSIVIMGSKNVSAPGPGAAAYSVAKAGLTQLARVAALEFAGDGIRVNVLHPNQVFDTAIWSDDVLAQRAKHYGLSILEYKRNNLLQTEITSQDVAQLVLAMVGPAFAKTTGAQIPIDGGNERVI